MSPAGPDLLDAVRRANPVDEAALPDGRASDAGRLRAAAPAAGARPSRRTPRWLSPALTAGAIAVVGGVLVLALPRGQQAVPPGGTTQGPPKGKMAPPPDAPDFDLEVLSGQVVGGGRLSPVALRGRAAVMAFVASWCDPCQAQARALARLASRNPGILVVAVASMDRRSQALTAFPDFPPGFVDNLGRGRGPNAPSGTVLALDPKGEALAAFGSRGVPATYLIDPEGRIVWSVNGPGLEGIEAQIQTLPDPSPEAASGGGPRR